MWILVSMIIGSVQSETRVQVTTPINPITVGGILPFQCQIWNMQDDYGVMIARRIDGQVQRVTMGNVILDSPVLSRVFLAVRSLTGGSKIYFLTMLNVTPLDQGQYWCTVTAISHTGVTRDLARDLMNVQIRSFPAKGNPSCTINPNKLVYQEGDRFELLCSSERGSPPVQLKWSRLGFTEYFPPINSSTENKVYSKVEITANSIYQNAMFICDMTSQAFPDYRRTCSIGLIVTQQRSAAESPSLVTQRSRETHFNIVNAQNTVTNDCSDTCESSSKTVFYLIIFTMAASLLCLIFIITTTVMCCKYCNKSTEVRQRHQYIPTPPSRVADPVYRSMERRSDNELVYMTLEDPNNPEGKVLLPKEVLDEFYNKTLTLRKN